jgi:hypothetical protein
LHHGLGREGRATDEAHVHSPVSRALGNGPGATEPIAAAARFLASPKRERFVFQATLEAIAVMRGEAKPESDTVRVD